MPDDSESRDVLLERESQFAATRIFEPEESFTRQEEDIAIAAELLQAGLVNEREIVAAVSDWSIHGNVSLAEHLQKRSLINAEHFDALRQRAVARVDRARRSIAGGSQMPAAGKSMMLATLERLDGSGRVAKLLGVTVAARGGEDEARVMEGRYELIRKLGQGGLGRVWLARDVNLNRHVALKEISHGAGVAESVIERFKYEAEITGRLEHPSIVPIYQLGQDLATGRAFYAMRFLGKATLQDSINEYHERREAGDDDPMLLRRLLTAFVNVCHAIGHAHSRKVIHRDLKPENVVIDSFGQVIVIDWGLAKIIDDASVESLMDSSTTSSADRTSEGQVLGTPLYMAPEQAAGRLDELDYRTDIYGLGAILFAIVTGNAPHEKTQRQSADSGLGARGMISVIATGVAPAARDVNAEVDPALEAICSKAMARRRYARYQQAVDLADDVQRWMAGEKVTAYRESFRQRAGRAISQHRRLSQALVAATMVVLVALTTLAMAARQNRQAALQARFSQLNSQVREVELQMRGLWTDLAKDARFLAALPTIQSLVSAHGASDDDREELWRDQLRSIFATMLQSNPDYLAISLEFNVDNGAKEIARVARASSDRAMVRIVPDGRLQTVKDDPLQAAVSLLEPGDLKYSLEPRARYGSDGPGGARISVASPVDSDDTGKAIGMTVIEADVVKRAIEALANMGTIDGEIFVADGLGQIWGFADPRAGVQGAETGTTIPELPADVVSEVAKRGKPFLLRGENRYVAQRFYVDPTGRGVLIFARLFEGE
ncbi:MAG: protein kinase [Planctomycetaceae bacterium]|nr:protein kinase [Planctomycetaceae bacterium]